MSERYQIARSKKRGYTVMDLVRGAVWENKHVLSSRGRAEELVRFLERHVDDLDYPHAFYEVRVDPDTGELRCGPHLEAQRGGGQDG